MSVRSGTHRLGPERGTLSVHTKRGGAAAKAGHDLVIEVGSWSATLTLAEDAAESSVELSADPSSLRVVEGSGGMQELGPDDIANIEQTIDDEVLEGREITFRSTTVTTDGDRIRVEGELGIGERSGPIGFELAVGEAGALSANAVVKQSDWGIKPYSALFGALKVRDEVVVSFEDPRSVPIDGLSVEAAFDPRRQLAGAVRVHRDLLDRLHPLRDRCRHRPPRLRSTSVRLSGSASSAAPASSRALSRMRPAAVVIAASVPADGAVLKPWPTPNRSVSAGNHLDVERGNAELGGDQLGVIGLALVGLGGQAEHHLAGRVNAQEHCSVGLVSHRHPPHRCRRSRARSRSRSWCARSALCSSKSQKAGCGPPKGCGGAAGRSHPG